MGVPDRLAITVTHADGTVTRWGGDEPDAQDVPGDLTFDTRCPGGFATLSCSLLRDIRIDYPDLRLFDDIRVYGPGNRTAWEGRMLQFPRSHGDTHQVSPSAVGWGAHLKDDPSFVEVYVDQGLAAWGGPSLVERAKMATDLIDFAALSQWDQDQGLSIALPNQALNARTISTVWYRPPAGVKIQKIQYAATDSTWPATVEGPYVMSAASDIYDGALFTALTFDGQIRTAQPSTAYRYAGFRVWTSNTAVTPSPGAMRRITKIAMIGDHGLTLHTTQAGDPDGVYASDAIRDIVERAAPMLTWDTSNPSTAWPINHLAFHEPTTAEDAILQTNKFDQWDWGVYDQRRFFYRPADPDRLTWEARLSDGAQVEFEGDTGELLFNGVLVVYEDARSGRTLTVGPPGANADATDATLEDTSAENPVNAHSIPRRWGVLRLSSPAVQRDAIQLGATFLAERMLPQRRGSITLTGQVRHPTEGMQPVWRIRAGDFIRVADHPASGPRKIISTSYNHGTRTVRCELDNTRYALEAILERLGVALVGVL